MNNIKISERKGGMVCMAKKCEKKALALAFFTFPKEHNRAR
jgi:hypothetical protein